MTDTSGTVIDLLGRLKSAAPESYNLLTAQDDAEFEAAFEPILQGAIERLEINKKNFNTLKEDGLSGVLAAGLSMPGILVTQETNSNGHVDITIQVGLCEPRRKKLGEAKIYDGPKYHIDGLQQLLKRYTTGREARGLLIAFVRQQDIAGIVIKIRSEMDKQLPERQQGTTQDLALIKWAFLSTHTHSSGEDVQVGHYGCNLYLDKED